MKIKIKRNVKLAGYTTLHVGGPARFFIEAKTVDEIRKAVNFAEEKKIKTIVLGGGSNVLVPDKGIGGLVVRIKMGGMVFSGEKVYAGAGEEWDKVVAQAVSRDLSGIENLSLIPGTVGGAVYQNIGAYGAELKDVLIQVDVFDAASGKARRIPAKNCNFSYRTSIFQEPKGRHLIILGASFELSRKFKPDLKYPDLLKYFGLSSEAGRFKRTAPKITVKSVRRAIIKIRKSKLVYPTAGIGSAGSFFKNPTVSNSKFQILNSESQGIIGRETGGSRIKLSAGQLIEKAGWKGRRIGRVGVSKKHALVLVSYRGARAGELLKLSEKIKKSVKNKFGVDLTEEVRMLP